MPCKIHYFSLTDEQTKTEKLEWFKNTKFQDIDFEQVKPDKNANWINLTDNDFESLIPVAVKKTISEREGNRIFEIYTNGIVTARDEWVYDFDKVHLENKIRFFFKEYNNILNKWQQYLLQNSDVSNLKSDALLNLSNDFVYRQNVETKWSSRLRRDKLLKNREAIFSLGSIRECFYRPYTKKHIYLDYISIDIVGQQLDVFPKNNSDNTIIFTSGNPHNKQFQTYCSKIPFDFGCLETTNGFPLYRYENGVKVENITDWALELFRNNYELRIINDEIKDKIIHNSSFIIQKNDIFHYVYAVLHQPAYRQKYEQNLKREFPRVPLYADFWKYAQAGRNLMELHLNYEAEITNYKPLLERKDIDLEVFKSKKAGKKKKTEDADKEVSEVASTFTVYPILKIRDNHIEIDELTTLCNVPAQALAYKLGNRSAIEWILDQYKPYKSDDKTIQEKFNSYNFADYKEQIIELLQKVCWVSVETMKIVGEL